MKSLAHNRKSDSDETSIDSVFDECDYDELNDELSSETEKEGSEEKMTGVGNYTFLRTIGHGQFGKVKLAVHKKTQARVAVKIVKKSGIDKGTSRFIQREVQTMKRLHHPNIIRLYEVIDTDTYIFLVMEYASGGEVMDFISVHGKLKERDASNFFAQVACAVHYCHSQRTVHRDIKAENLLLDEHMNVKLIDFGLSNVFAPPQKLRTFCGSPLYAAPELIQHHEYVGPEVDCWSLGVLLYFLVCGELPFGGESYAELYQHIMCANYKLPGHLSPACQDLIRHMLVPEPAKRFTIDQIMRHPWVMKQSQGQVKAGHWHETIDTTVLARLEELGYERTAVTQSLLAKRFDDPSAAYYILSAETECSCKGKEKAKETSGMGCCENKATKTSAAAAAKPATLTIGDKSSSRNNNGSNGREAKESEVEESKHYYSLKAERTKKKTEQDEGLISGESESAAEGPRQKRFAFNVEMTTETDCRELIWGIKHALDLHSPHIRYAHLTPFMLECDCVFEDLIFEVEVCRLYRLSLNGVRFHKIKGKAAKYKEVMKSIVSALRL